MITIKELSIDTESAEKIIDLIKKHEPEIWSVLKEELKQAFSLTDVVVPKGTLCNKNENKLGMCNCCGDNNCHDYFCKG